MLTVRSTGHGEYSYQQSSYGEQGYDGSFGDSPQHYYEGGSRPSSCVRGMFFFSRSQWRLLSFGCTSRQPSVQSAAGPVPAGIRPAAVFLSTRLRRNATRRIRSERLSRPPPCQRRMEQSAALTECDPSAAGAGQAGSSQYPQYQRGQSGQYGSYRPSQGGSGAPTQRPRAYETVRESRADLSILCSTDGYRRDRWESMCIIHMIPRFRLKTVLTTGFMT